MGGGLKIIKMEGQLLDMCLDTFWSPPLRVELVARTQGRICTETFAAEHGARNVLPCKEMHDQSWFLQFAWAEQHAEARQTQHILRIRVEAISPRWLPPSMNGAARRPCRKVDACNMSRVCRHSLYNDIRNHEVAILFRSKAYDLNKRPCGVPGMSADIVRRVGYLLEDRG